MTLKLILCSELGRIKNADPTLNHKEAFKQAAANWQQSKSSASIDSHAETSAEPDCQGVSISDHHDRKPARLANSQGPAETAGMGSAVADSSDESDEADEENRGVQAQEPSQFRRLYKPAPYNAFMKRGKFA